NLAVIATDHCPFLKKEKDGWQNDIANLPMGLPGVEVLGALVLNRNNCLDPVTAIKVLTENPARIFGLYPEKGSLEPGTDADICVFDPAHEWQINHRELHMANDYSPYEGLKIQGRNCMTFLRGEMIFDSLNGWAGKKGAGKFLKRKKTDQVFFS
ncbi:MAG: amidohydrolase family protein, partial [Candidatus Rifleibacteriota bacterium]